MMLLPSGSTEILETVAPRISSNPNLLEMICSLPPVEARNEPAVEHEASSEPTLPTVPAEEPQLDPSPEDQPIEDGKATES